MVNITYSCLKVFFCALREHALDNTAHALSSHSAYVLIKTKLLCFKKEKTELFSNDLSFFQFLATVISCANILSS